MRTRSRQPAPNQEPLPWHESKKTCHHRMVYGLTCFGFDEMRWRAAGRCEICRVPQERLYKGRLLIDHDHRLGNSQNHIRGLICPKCNAAMKYVDNGFRKPTHAQLMYIYNSWFWQWLPDEHRDEPYFPPSPSYGGVDATYWDSPHYRRRCLSRRVESPHTKDHPCPPAQEKRGRESILLWETAEASAA